MALHRKLSPHPEFEDDIVGDNDSPGTDRARQVLRTMMYLDDAIAAAEDAPAREYAELMLAVTRTCAELGFLTMAKRWVSEIDDDYDKALALIAIANSLMLRGQDASVYIEGAVAALIKIRTSPRREDPTVAHGDHQSMVYLLCEMAKLSFSKPVEKEDAASADLSIS